MNTSRGIAKNTEKNLDYLMSLQGIHNLKIAGDVLTFSFDQQFGDSLPNDAPEGVYFDLAEAPF